MSTEDAVNNLLAAAKQNAIDDFNQDPNKKKAYALFRKYGAALPANIIHFLRDEAGKYVGQENAKGACIDQKDTKKVYNRKKSHEVLRECYVSINWDGMQVTRAYNKYSDILDISVSAFQKRYLKKYPLGCNPIIFPDNLTIK